MRQRVKTYNLRQTVLLVLAVLLAGAGAHAQEYRYEGGVSLGMSSYMGDVNRNVLKHPGFAGGFLFRYLINKRFAVKVDLATAGIKGRRQLATGTSGQSQAVTLQGGGS